MNFLTIYKQDLAKIAFFFFIFMTMLGASLLVTEKVEAQGVWGPEVLQMRNSCGTFWFTGSGASFQGWTIPNSSRSGSCGPVGSIHISGYPNSNPPFNVCGSGVGFVGGKYDIYQQTCVPSAINGSCGGSVNGCATGSFSDRTDSPTQYLWRCNGSGSGHSDANCSAPKPPPTINGSCGGSVNGCATGSFSDRTDSPTQYLWRCNGSGSGHSDANCSAPIPASTVNGQCGSSNNSCILGSLSNTTDSATQYRWNCLGSGPGHSDDVCTAPIPASTVNGQCGSSNNSCILGSLSNTTDSATQYRWNCLGSGPGHSDDVCTAPIPASTVNGQCGSSNNSCILGSLSNTTDSATQYRWNCLGSGPGHSDDVCTAPIPATPTNGASCLGITAPSSVETGQTFPASIEMSNSGGTTWTSGALYRLGTQSPQDNTRWGGTNRVTLSSNVGPGGSATFSRNFTAPGTPGTYSFNWRMVQDGVEWFGGSCTDTIIVTAPPVPVVGQCGTANGSSNTARPSSNLCNLGGLSWTDLGGTDGAWNWTCEGASGGGDDFCSANVQQNGSCGLADGTSSLSQPTTNQCASGSYRNVSNTATQFRWSCDGNAVGTNDSCFANIQVNGICGGSDGGSFRSSPLAGLCTTGTPTLVTDDGTNWNWSCSGNSFGSADSCSAEIVIDGQCSSTKNSCIAGTPVGTSYTNDTPTQHIWTCNGQGTGHTDDSCTAPIVFDLLPVDLSSDDETNTVIDAINGQYDDLDVQMRIRNDGPDDLPPGASVPYRFVIKPDPALSISDIESPISSSTSGITGGNSSGPGYLTQEFNNVPFGNHEICGRVNMDGTTYPESAGNGNNELCVPLGLDIPRPTVFGITADKELVRQGDTANIAWEIETAYSLRCTVSGPGLTSTTFNTVAGLNTGNADTTALNNFSIYSMECTDTVTGLSIRSEDTVEVIPTIEEI